MIIQDFTNLFTGLRRELMNQEGLGVPRSLNRPIEWKEISQSSERPITKGIKQDKLMFYARGDYFPLKLCRFRFEFHYLKACSLYLLFSGCHSTLSPVLCAGTGAGESAGSLPGRSGAAP